MLLDKSSLEILVDLPMQKILSNEGTRGSPVCRMCYGDHVSNRHVHLRLVDFAASSLDCFSHRYDCMPVHSSFTVWQVQGLNSAGFRLGSIYHVSCCLQLHCRLVSDKNCITHRGLLVKQLWSVRIVRIGRAKPLTWVEYYKNSVAQPLTLCRH